MGRPRQHNEQTREALLTAAEQLIAHGGLDAVSTRAVAEQAGATTRAVYSLFGSKQGLLHALAARGFLLLADRVQAVPVTADPGADLVNVCCLRLPRLGAGPPQPVPRGLRAARYRPAYRPHRGPGQPRRARAAP